LSVFFLLAIVLSVFLLTIVLSVFLRFIDPDYPFDIVLSVFFFVWPLYCLSFSFVHCIVGLFSFDQCIVCLSSIYSSWLPFWNLQTFLQCWQHVEYFAFPISGMTANTLVDLLVQVNSLVYYCIYLTIILHLFKQIEPI
jgi:hypothetical protein